LEAASAEARGDEAYVPKRGEKQKGKTFPQGKTFPHHMSLETHYESVAFGKTFPSV
jgi:hypothetical protein